MRLSPTQTRAVALLREWGRLQRYPGGYWGEPGFEGGDRPAEYVGTPTIQVLHDRHLLDVLCADGSWQWDGHSAPRFAVPTEKLVRGDYATRGDGAPR